MKTFLCFVKRPFPVLILCLALCLDYNLKAQTALSAGDIAFTGYNSNNNGTGVQNDFSFVLLTNITSGTTINFTDNGYKIAGTNALGTSEGTLVWTSSSPLPQFTHIYVQINEAGNAVTSVSSGSILAGFSNFILSQAGDQVLAYQGSSASPTFISGIHMNSESTATAAGWDNLASGTTLSSTRSDLPPGLINGVNAIMAVVNPGTSSAEKDNCVYNCTGASGATLGDIRSAINNVSNWNLQDVTLYTLPPSCTFSISSPLSASTNSTMVSCNGGSDGTASVTVSGGVLPYNYFWSPSGGTSNTASGLAAGSYTCTITDNSSQQIIKTFTVTQPAANSELPAPANANQTLTVASGANSFKGSNCQEIIASLSPGSTDGVSGDVTAKVFVQGSAGTYNNQPYVRRYYDITPASATSTVTADVTLYFTQADFDNYNANRGSAPSLPVSTTDAENYKANLRITQQHGSSTTGAPGSYTGWSGTGAAIVLITPASVTYNATGSRWEVTFPVTGFSGFFAHSGEAPLPVTLAAFEAKKTENVVLLSWQTTSEVNSDHFDIERSTNGKNWEAIGKVEAMNNSQALQPYTFKDLSPRTGENLYRLKMVDVDGSFAYSRLRGVTFEVPDEVVLYPNPADGPVQVRVSSRYIGSQATLIDGSGKVLRTFKVTTENFPLRLNKSGVYLLRMYDGKVVKGR